MGFNEFVEYARVALQERTGLEVRVRNIRKNNCEKVALWVVETESNVCETIYLEEFYMIHQSGVGVEQLMDFMHSFYKSHRINEYVDISSVLNFSDIRHNIMFGLIGYEKNKEWLATMPHRRFLDMAVVYYYMIDATGYVLFRIHNEHMIQWGVSESDLFETAMRYTPERLPAITMGLEQFVLNSMTEDLSDSELMELIASSVEDEDGVELPEDISIDEIRGRITRALEAAFGVVKSKMIVLSNMSVQGAACILYPDCLRKLADSKGTDLYILPCSVNEVILLPVDEDAETYREMVAEVNQNVLDIEDILTDSIYIYKRATDSIDII